MESATAGTTSKCPVVNDWPPLLTYLAETRPTQPLTWQSWQIAPVTGGANNLLYHVTNLNNPTEDFAVKFTVRDTRNRATREFHALTALQQAARSIAPAPLFVDMAQYRQPVVVQRWLTGVTWGGPPTTPQAWQSLLDHFCTIHDITPAKVTIALDSAVLNVDSGAAGKALIRQEVAKLPPTARPAVLQRLLDWTEWWQPPQWTPPQPALCRGDANWRNFIANDGRLLSVDWENSGWGDPAFEIAELIAHPAYSTVPNERWSWLIDAYAAQRQEADTVTRIHTYLIIMRIWWVARSARTRYEAPRGLDERLAKRPDDWQQQAEQLWVRSVTLAQSTITQLVT
jgi:aminoglycoside phosphotransferase (APT) family kinase protein